MFISNMNCFLYKCLQVGPVVHSAYQQFIEVSLGWERIPVAWKLQGKFLQSQSVTFSCTGFLKGKCETIPQNSSLKEKTYKDSFSGLEKQDAVLNRAPLV